MISRADSLESGNVAPDCSFTIARQSGLEVLGAYKQVLLTSQQRARFVELLERMTATALPERLGGGPQVDVRRITLASGGNALRAAASDDSTRVMQTICKPSPAAGEYVFDLRAGNASRRH